MKAYGLIEYLENWTARNISEDVYGNPDHWRSVEASKFNLQGAIHAAYRSEDLHFIYRRIYADMDLDHQKSLAYYSSIWGHEQCYAFLKRLDL